MLIDCPHASGGQFSQSSSAAKLPPLIGGRTGPFELDTLVPREGFYEACLLCLPISVFGHHLLVAPVKSCSADQSERGSCVSDQCLPILPEISSPDSRQLWEVASDLRGQSGADRCAGEVSVAHGRVLAFPHRG